MSGKQEVSDTQEIEGSLPEYSSSCSSVQKLKWKTDSPQTPVKLNSRLPMHHHPVTLLAVYP